MTNLSGSLLTLRTAYGNAQRKLLGEGRPAEARTIEVCEALIESLPPESLALFATQNALHHLIGALPENRDTDRWRVRAAAHFLHLRVILHEPLYSLLYRLPLDNARGLRPEEVTA